MRRAYKWLTLVALAGGAAVTLLVRWLRGGGGEASPLVELAESRVEAEETLEPEALDDARYAPARGRVIRAYVRRLGPLGGGRVAHGLFPASRSPDGPAARGRRVD
jgi:hypothetical protein